MPAFISSPAESRILPDLNQEVLVNGSRDDRIWCSKLARTVGCGGTTAEFTIPEMLFDSPRSELDGALIQVRIWPSDQDKPDNPQFVGFLDRDGSEISDSDDAVTVQASSPAAYLSRVSVGSGDSPPRAVVTYKLINPVTGAKTNVTPLSIIRDIIAGLPDDYRTYIKLGNTSVLNDSGIITPPEISFRLTKANAAIEQMLGWYGDVAIVERFQGVACYLDFIRINNPAAPISYVRLNQFEDPVVASAQIAQYSKQRSSLPTINRVRGYGRRREFVISTSNYIDADGQREHCIAPTAAQILVPDWNPDYEDAVLANPQAAHTGSIGYSVACDAGATAEATSFAIVSGIPVTAGAILLNRTTGEQMRVTAYVAGVAPAGTVAVTRQYNSTPSGAIDPGEILVWLMPGIDQVFRRFRLPACLRGIDKAKDLPIIFTMATGDGKERRYPVQVWKWTTAPGATGEGGKVLTYNWLAQPELMRAWSKLDLANDTFTLDSPAIAPISTELVGDDVKTVYTPTTIGITLTIMHNWLYYDTGAPGTAFGPALASDGLAADWQRDDFQYAQATNVAAPIPVGSTNYLFPALWFDLDGDEPGKLNFEPHTASTPTIFRNDYDALRQECLNVLSERNQLHVGGSVTIDYYAPGYKPGNRISIENAPREPGTHTLTSIEFTMPINGDNSTRLTSDNTKPPKRKTRSV